MANDWKAVSDRGGTMEEIRINYLLKQLKASLEQYDRHHVHDLDITSGQCILLNYLMSRKQESLSSTDVHRAMGISKATVSNLLKSLRKKGYLIMEGDGQDDRRKRLILTEKAYDMQPQIEAALKKRGEDICEEIPGEELMVMEQVLDRMLSNLKQKISESKEE